MTESKPLRTVVINPEFTKELVTKAQEHAKLTTECPKCETEINLETRPYTWTINEVNYQFTKVPTYRCEPCKTNYYPEPVVRSMEHKINELNPIWQPQSH